MWNHALLVRGITELPARLRLLTSAQERTPTQTAGPMPKRLR
jgi:hypothetical protein